jgi:hypothetical protein
MKKTARLWISWADRYGPPPKMAEQLMRDKRRVKEILTQAECAHLFDVGHGPELDVKVESKEFSILIQELQKDPIWFRQVVYIFGDHTRVTNWSQQNCSVGGRPIKRSKMITSTMLD